MRKTICLVVALLAIASAGGALAQVQLIHKATGEFKTSVGETVGNATLTQNADGSVRVEVQVRGLPPGTHGIHFHSVGACTPDFAAAGPHFNPGGKKHGLNNPDGPHAGDLPNLTIAADGSGTLDTTTTMVSLTPSDKTLFDADGSALIIHAFEDDQQTDPAGNSGDRIACTVLRLATAPQQPPAQPAPQQPDQSAPQQPGQPAPPASDAPARLPDTSGSGLPAIVLVLAALLLLGGALVRRGAAARG